MVKGKNKTVKAQEKGFFVYLGPSIRGAIQTASVYEGTREEVEAFLAGAIEKYPQIKRFLISDKTLPEDRVKIKTPGNSLYEQYRRFVAELKRNKEG